MENNVTSNLHHCTSCPSLSNATRYTCPFKVGELGESKSFLKGFRGSWFRCEIKEISSRKGGIGPVLKFIDFLDEKLKWTKLYQKPPVAICKSKEITREIMVRPCFPPIFHESEMPDITSIAEVTVIVDDLWKVGDLVDWCHDSCYWSGKLTKLLDNYMATVVLPDPPIGEGKSYDVSCKDLRPSLDWSEQCGWTLPVHGEGENFRHCARIVLPANHCKIEKEGGGSLIANSGIGKTSCSDSVSSSVVRDPADSMDAAASKKEPDVDERCSKKMRSSERKPLTSDSDSVDTAIVQLEEIANKIKWLKGILQSGTLLPNAVRSSWQVLEHRGTSTPKYKVYRMCLL